MARTWHILLPDGTREGPYTEEDLLDLLDAGELSSDAISESIPGRHRSPVGQLFQVIPPADEADDEAEDETDDDEDAVDEQDDDPPPASAREPVPWTPAPLPATRESPRAEAPAPAPTGPRLCWTGNPSFVLYLRSILVSGLLIGAGWYAGRLSGEWLAAGLLSGGTLLLLTIIRRSATRYTVTTRRVEVQRGLLSKSSREVRIQDVRSINVTKSGLAGLFGIGTVEFASAGTEGEDVTFHHIWRAHAVKALVRRLQDREG